MERRDFILGEEVRKLETMLAEYVGRKYAIAVSSGTAAQFLIMRGLGIGPGDVVAVPDFTFLSTATTVLMTGATPLFIEVDPDTFTMSAAHLLLEISKQPEGAVKAIVPVDLFGVIYDEYSINQISDKFGIPVIEDGCHSLGSTLEHKEALSFGDYAFTSFYPTKPLGAFGDGGMVFCDDVEMSDAVRSLRNHCLRGDNYAYVMGYNFRMDTMTAAILLEKFTDFEESVNIRKHVAHKYREYLDKDAYAFQLSPGFSNWAVFSILCNCVSRDFVQQALTRAGYPSEIYYPQPLHELEMFVIDVDEDFRTDVTQELCNRILQIPLNPYMSERETNNIIGVLNNVEEDARS
jgi:dTDP-4-amino-4,6-dideoxygalactose transaminase